MSKRRNELCRMLAGIQAGIAVAERYGGGARFESSVDPGIIVPDSVSSFQFQSRTEDQEVEEMPMNIDRTR